MIERTHARREFLRWTAGSSLLAPFAFGCHAPRGAPGPGAARNVFDLEERAHRALGHDAYAYLAGGADDELTLAANRAAFQEVAIRARRLVDVRTVDTSLELFGQRLSSPILLAPVGFQGLFHPGAEVASARAAAVGGHRMLVSSVSSFSVGEVAAAHRGEVWFQLYPTPDRTVTRGLLGRAEAAGCTVTALTVDTPVIGNRERHNTTLAKLLAGGELRMGNYEGLGAFESINDPSMTWDMVAWLKNNSRLRVVLKGIVTAEDAELAVRHGADGVIVSNHGGRQLDSGLGTFACLAEVVAAIGGRMPVLIDGGFRRGTDVFKALALGADAICVGRPYCWGLAAYGEAGVARALELLQAELVRTMQLAGTASLAEIHRSHLT
jgi:isopentenyl diphosphate isomerase/L-lactate dehydrogenase-like FMN-dependent dehydrogenase